MSTSGGYQLADPEFEDPNFNVSPKPHHKKLLGSLRRSETFVPRRMGRNTIGGSAMPDLSAANILFSVALAKRLAKFDCAVFSVNPGCTFIAPGS